MLYVTTRNHQDAYTTNHVLTRNCELDGGLFVPLNFPKLSVQDRKTLSGMSFGQRVAEILNLFFSTRLTGWDIDFSIGRYPARLELLAHRIFMAETWHNPEGMYLRLEKNLMELLSSEAKSSGNWVSIAVRMAVLVGILGHSEIPDTTPVDISVITGDFTVPISIWYLRKMGFPIGNIICCSNENNQLWDLFCNGQMKTDTFPVSTIVSEADVAIPVNLERLLSGCGTISETEYYLNCCKTGTVYSASENLLQRLRKEIFVSVVSSNRIETTIPNVFKTHNYVLSPASALAYSGLLDYRAKTGITRNAIVICDNSPLCDADTVANVMNIPVAQLQKFI